MTNLEVLNLINDGADFYCRQLGNASHMKFINNGVYSMIYPKEGQKGGTSIFDISLDHLNDEEVIRKVKEIKELNVHTWWGICLSERIYKFVYGDGGKPILTPEQHEEQDDEFYMALFPEEKHEYSAFNHNITVKKVETVEEFAIWADINNLILHNNYPIMHRENHFPISQNGIMPCYIGYYEDKPASASAIMTNNHISSLEFVATLKEFRNKGLARAVCQFAVENAFKSGSEIITTRAFRDAKNLYKSLGFKIYF